MSGAPPHFDGLCAYESRLEALVASGVIADRGQVYWQARLSDRHPTVEVRCLDVQLRADDAVMLAGIVRGLVATAIAEEKAGMPLPAVAPELARAADRHAARHGLDGADGSGDRGRHDRVSRSAALIRRSTRAPSAGGRQG
ncbi:hypothetical protein ACFQ71_18690 [Streptomyces sp. NPDC056534]|uniref:hypothetical protein n=1 Tax=Streptomyces sp. NPDC056534 TaxID=3345857 RepID=UPI00369A221E